MINALFISTLGLDITCTILVLYSLLQPTRRIWPPQTEKPLGRIVMLLLFNLTGAGIITLGILDWGAGSFPFWIRLFGGLFWMAGMVLAVKAVIILGAKNTSGNPIELVVKGPYRWTRNPQYLGFMVGLIGWGLMSNSIFTLAGGIAGCLPLILVPRAEEPWLLEKFGPAYAEYLKKTPRFLLLK